MVNQRNNRRRGLIGLAVLLLLSAAVVAGYRPWERSEPPAPPPVAVVTPEAVALPVPEPPPAEPSPPPPAEAQPEPEPEPAWHPPVPRVPVLMYHEIAAGPNSLYVAPHELAAHLEYLTHKGYTPVTLEQVYLNFTGGGPLPERPVVLTFDDGYISFYTNAMPLLRQHGAAATLFVISGFVGKPGYVTWDQVTEMAAEGIEMGAHTVTHHDLTTLRDDQLAAQIRDSRAAIEQRTGRAVTFFAYPSGRYDDRTPAAVKNAGLHGAVITKRGFATPCQDLMLWRRVRVNKGTSVQALAALLELAESETPLCDR